MEPPLQENLPPIEAYQSNSKIIWYLIASIPFIPNKFCQQKSECSEIRYDLFIFFLSLRIDKVKCSSIVMTYDLESC